MELILFLLLVGGLVVYKFKEWNFYFQQNHKVDENLDLITNLLLDDIEYNNTPLELGEHTIRVLRSDKIRYIWISNHPYAYGHYYTHDTPLLYRYKGIKYSTYKRVRKLHNHLLKLQSQEEKDKLDTETDKIISELRTK